LAPTGWPGARRWWRTNPNRTAAEQGAPQRVQRTSIEALAGVSPIVETATTTAAGSRSPSTRAREP
jgi:hypothetical protein